MTGSGSHDRELVRAKGLEPPHLAILVPKTSASTNSATPAADELPYRLPPAKQGSALIEARRKGQAARPAERGGGTERRGRAFPQGMIEDQAMQNQRHGSDDYERARVPPATPPVIDRNADPEDAALRAM